MDLNPKALKSKADELREAARRLDELARKREEIDRETREVEAWFAQVYGPKSSSLMDDDSGIYGSGPRTISGLLKQESNSSLRKVTQNEAILQAVGNEDLTRDEIFDKLGLMNKAPKDPNQLSALLSKLKKRGYLIMKGGRWSAAPREFWGDSGSSESPQEPSEEA